MKDKQKRSISCILAFLAAANITAWQRASAQVHAPFLPENNKLSLVEEQYLQDHYEVAAQTGERYFSEHKSIENTAYDAKDRATFYLTLSYLKTEQVGCVDTAVHFINTTANPAYRQRVAYTLAQYYFRNNMFAEAIPYYEMAGIANLTNREIANSKFELAYCYFNTKQFDRAEPLLAAIKELEGKYYDAGNYYYGLLTYNQGDYPTALQSFERIADNKEYKDIVPYYIAEIRYFTGDKDKALADAQSLIGRKEKLYYHNELHLLAAQVLFEKQKYKEALPYFEYYYDNTDKIRKEDLYEMAYCYYRLNNWSEAVEKFKPLSDTRDSLGQTAMYLLGDCYLKTNDKKSARAAFGICADMPFNRGQQEASLLLAAKLSYEMGYHDEAIARISELFENYPSSPYKDEAKTLLSDLLIRTNSYEEAYKTMKDVARRDDNYRRVYQKATYGYAMQLLQQYNLSLADEMLSESLKYPVDNAYEAAANFWKGDIAYRSGQFSEAIIYTERFLKSDAANTAQKISAPATTDHAYMNMGYASMAVKDFKAAQDYFGRSRGNRTDVSAFSVNAILREADAVFMQKNYTAAEALYDRVIAANGNESDYARYQKAILLGLQGKNNEKTSLLTSIIAENPPSAYATDARYEMALAQIEQSRYRDAINTLIPLTEAHQKRGMVPKAWMKIGFAEQQLNNDDKAIEAYRRIVLEHPTSEERPAALDALRNLYIENNRPDDYAKLLQENNISPDELSLDSAYYAAAETQMAAGNKANTKVALTQYLTKYPNGAFATKAHYYKAELHFQQKEYKEALAGYDYVLNAPWSDFSENSARRAAMLAYQNNDYNAAMNYYGMLRNHAMGPENLGNAYNGMMLSSYNLNRYEEAAAYADTLAALPGVDPTLVSEAQLYKARAMKQAGKNEAALAIYRQLTGAKKAATILEANYHIAEAYFKQDQLKEAEEYANKALQGSGNEYWTVRSYLLIADILVKQKDYFNAKATLQSLVKNVKIEELKKEATQKLEEVKALEKKQSKLSD